MSGVLPEHAAFLGFVSGVLVAALVVAAAVTDGWRLRAWASVIWSWLRCRMLRQRRPKLAEGGIVATPEPRYDPPPGPGAQSSALQRDAKICLLIGDTACPPPWMVSALAYREWEVVQITSDTPVHVWAWIDQIDCVVLADEIEWPLQLLVDGLDSLARRDRTAAPILVPVITELSRRQREAGAQKRAQAEAASAARRARSGRAAS